MLSFKANSIIQDNKVLFSIPFTGLKKNSQSVDYASPSASKVTPARNCKPKQKQQTRALISTGQTSPKRTKQQLKDLSHLWSRSPGMRVNTRYLLTFHRRYFLKRTPVSESKQKQLHTLHTHTHTHTHTYTHTHTHTHTQS